MTAPSFPVIREILKLLVEPIRDTPLHNEYIHMSSVLAEFVLALKEFEELLVIVQQV